MKLTMDREELLTAARRAAQIAPAQTPLEDLKNVLLETDPNRRSLIITATNLEVSLRQLVPIREISGGEQVFAINAKLLPAMLECLAGDAVTITVNDDYQAAVESGDASYSIKALDGASFPQVEIPFPEDTVKVSGIPALVRRTVFAVAEEDGTALLKCVDLRFTSEGLCAVGSDGHCVVSARGDKQSTGNIDFLVPAASLEKLARLCENETVFSVGTTGHHIVFLGEKLTYSARIMEGKYVDLDQLMKNIRTSFTVLGDAAELYRAVSSVTAVEAENVLGLCFEEDKLRVHTCGANGTAEMTVDVIPLTGQPQGEYFFIPRVLERALKAFGGMTTLGIAQGGILTLTSEDAFFMQTAMRKRAQSQVSSKKAA